MIINCANPIFFVYVLGSCVLRMSLVEGNHLIVTHQKCDSVSWVRLVHARYTFIQRSLQLNYDCRLHLASVVFMSQIIIPERKVLAVYPVFFFYAFIAWMVLMV